MIEKILMVTKGNLNQKKDSLLVLAMLGILIVLFVPIPSVVLDFLLILNFSFGILILLQTFYSEKPLDFSTFPSLLLITTLFRLSLNIAATRLILEGADAGKVIHSIGEFVVGGNYVIGFVVFFILVVVQYVVVTNGAQRVAEVAARFTLDSMPGKQMSIDADLNMGLITDVEAKERRGKIEKEANFYGAMDGASKFVKGDAIAGIIIIFIDVIGGLSIGIIQMGMSWGDALHTYTLLTVGDGIVTQIPSLIIAVSTGIIITRAATDSHLGDELVTQITSSPKTLFIVTLCLLGAMFLPGLPLMPLIILFIIFSIITYYSKTKVSGDGSQDDLTIPEQLVTSKSETSSVNDALKINPLELSIGTGLVSYLGEKSEFFQKQFEAIRVQFAKKMGVIIPEISVIDDSHMNENAYSISIHGLTVAKGVVYPCQSLAINAGKAGVELEGEKVNEPAYNLPAYWIESKSVEFARSKGYTVVDSGTLMITHFREIITRNLSDLLTRACTETLVDRVRERNAGLVDELVPGHMSIADVQSVLRELIKEGVSIRRFEIIVEALVDCAKRSSDKSVIIELVRQQLSSQIIQDVLDIDNRLNVLTIAPALERELIKNIVDMGGKQSLIVDPDKMEKLSNEISSKCDEMSKSKNKPVIVCAPQLRKPLKGFVDKIYPNIVVFSMSEIPADASVKSFSSIVV